MTSPIARPVASNPLAEKRWTEVDSLQLRTTKDSASHRRSRRISRYHLEAIERSLTPRDRLIISFVAEARLATGSQLYRRFFTNSADGRSARRALARLAEWRILDRLPRQVGGVRAGSDAFVYCLGPAGARLLPAGTRRMEAPGDRYIAHTLAITEVLVQLREAHHIGLLEVLERQTEPTCWRTYIGPMGARQILKPDLFLRLGVGALEDRHFIEIDMATEASGTLLTKARRYLAHYRTADEQRQHGVYPRVIWAARDGHRVEQIRDVLDRLPSIAKDLFLVCTQEDLLAQLVLEAHE
jgi:hypothetical protein